MLEINRYDSDRFEYYLNERIAYNGGEYDFTFEDRFVIYHVHRQGKIVYYAIDKKTSLTSEVTNKRTSPVSMDEYKSLIPDIYKAIRYTGARRTGRMDGVNPLELIDSIFRVSLPEYGYTVREEQIRLSKDMYKGLTKKTVSLCEAEVGTGKSLAYLVASVVAKYGKDNATSLLLPITVSTSSIELQKSLVEKDIPALSKVLQNYGLIDHPLSAVVRKGKEHYFCKLRYKDFFTKISQTPSKYAELIRYFLSSDIENKALDMDLLPLNNGVKARINVRSCSKCPYVGTCKYKEFLSDSVSMSKGLDFQVTNHNYYLMSEVKSNLLRPSAYAIIDEAHKLNDAAKQILGAEITAQRIEQYLKYVRADKYMPGKGIVFLYGINSIRDNSKRLFEHLYLLHNTEDSEIGKDTIIDMDDTLFKCIKEIAESIVVLEDCRQHGQGKYEGTGKRLLEDLRLFLKPRKINSWISLDENDVLSLCCSLKGTGDKLYTLLWSKNRSHVLTSGTMSDGSSFEFFKRENGISQVSDCRVLESITPSPFNYKRHTRLYIPDDLPMPDNNDTGYLNAVADRVVEIVNATNGHTAILFTSYKVLREIYDRTKGRLQKYKVISMSRSNKTAISEFKKSRNAVLFASGSMWEGIDCVGDTLSSVIIVRLPFPIRSANMEEKKCASENTLDFIQKYAVPEMLIKLRQGAGRLIRNESDSGLISILDTRAISEPYAEKVENALKNYPRISSIDDIRSFFKDVKSPDYFED